MGRATCGALGRVSPRKLLLGVFDVGRTYVPRVRVSGVDLNRSSSKLIAQDVIDHVYASPDFHLIGSFVAPGFREWSSDVDLDG
jgi:hypothetical protein